MAEFERQSLFLKDAVLLSPAALAHRVFEVFGDPEVEPHVQYTSVEHLKHMARVYLARRNEADSDENPAHGAQASFEFSGQLQDRYPVPRKSGEEPVYKLRSHLSEEERAWNVAQLRKSARSRLEHADALEAEGQMKAAG